MSSLKKRLAQIEAGLGAGDRPPKTFAELIKWATEREAANGGALSLEDRDRGREYFALLWGPPIGSRPWASSSNKR